MTDALAKAVADLKAMIQRAPHNGRDETKIAMLLKGIAAVMVAYLEQHEGEKK